MPARPFETQVPVRHRAPIGVRGGTAAWIAAVVVFIGFWQFGGQAKWAFDYPKAWQIPAQRWIGAAMKWLVDSASFGLFTFTDLTRFIASLIDLPYRLWLSLLSTGFLSGQGSSAVEIPDRKPDADTTYDVTPQQALLYRLCGDRNPLHADPEFARAAGFPAPILHGLCSYGIVLRTVTDELLGGDAGRVTGFSARFAGVVFPGETITVKAWDTGSDILVDATVAPPGGESRPALADCVVTRA